MSLLGRSDLRTALEQEELIVTPLLDPAQINRGSIDLRLGTEFLVLHRTKRAGIDPTKDASTEDEEMLSLYERVAVPFGEVLWLHPQHFVLAATFEFVGLADDMGAYVVGRSSWGRLGLVVATAVFVHPGYRGCLTLELANEGESPIPLSPGMRLAQLAVHRLENAARREPNDTEKYVAPVRPQAARMLNETPEFRRLRRLGDALHSRLG